MKRILVLGGYGTFGGRIAERGAAAGFEMLVAGRNFARAEAFCAGRDRLVPTRLDRSLDETLARLRPFAIVDAAGPFQASGYETARASIAAGCHYLDIADGSAFVAGIGALDASAKAAGVCAVSGASSVPALSGAVAARLAEGLERVAAVEIALSASSRGTAGRSVTAAILSYIGRPVRLRRGGRWTRAHGWQGLRRFDFEIEGAAPLRRRLAALAEVPDLELLPGRLPGNPAVSFFAGTDAPWHNLGLWLLSWPVRWKLIRRPERCAGLLSTLQRWTRGPGSLRSAFEMRLFGSAKGRRVERRWTLIAERGEGPEIPSLAVPILLGKLAAGAIAPGARDGGGLLSLEDFEPSLAGLAAGHELTERTLGPSLYARVMGERFEALPPAVRAIHEVLRDGGAAGEAEVRRGGNPIARAIASLVGFPAEGRHHLHVAFAERGGAERWTRNFSGRMFSSLLSEREGRLTERFGLLRFAFDLPSDQAGLQMIVRRWWLGPIPLPLFLAPRSEAREWEEDGRFHFDVPIALPLLGPLVHYRGWLEPLDGVESRAMDRIIISGGCHCRAVRFEAEASRSVEVLDCNCSICAATGFRHLIVPHSDFRLLSGEAALTHYRFGTGAADHLFCSVCGVKSFYQPRSHPGAWSLNVNALDDSSELSITVRAFDGRNWEQARSALGTDRDRLSSSDGFNP